MLTCDGPKVIEFNVRFGDPEAQVVIPAIDEPLAPHLAAAAAGAHDWTAIAFSRDQLVGVVLASGGYPGPVTTGVADRRPRRRGGAARGDSVPLGHEPSASGRIVTAGGRVLTVVGRGPTFEPPSRGPTRGRQDSLRRHALPARHRREGARQTDDMSETTVLILMGSDSDAPVMQAAVDTLKTLGISSEMTVASAHRSPERVMRLVREAPAAA